MTVCVWPSDLLLHINTSFLVVAEFTISDVATIAESESTLPVCITMTTNPPQGIIAKEVEMLISTVDGTGKT